MMRYLPQSLCRALRAERRHLLREAISGHPGERLRYAILRASAPVAEEVVGYGMAFYEQSKVTDRALWIFRRLNRIAERMHA